MELLALLQGVFTPEWLSSQLTTNSFLITGIFGALMYALRGIPAKVAYFINRQISIEFQITNEDPDYENTVKYLESKRLKLFSRTYTKRKDGDSPSGFMFDESENVKSSSDLTVGYGTSWFFVNGVLGYIHRQFKDSNHSNKLKEEIFVKLFTRRTKHLQDIIDKTSISKQPKDDRLRVCLPEDGWWDDTSKITKRDMESVFVPDEIKDKITNSLDTFIKSRDWYVKKGIPYKFGIFIEGEPGVGKSSLIKAICSYLERDMYFMTADAFSSKGFSSLVSCVKETNVLILEEIDTFASTNQRKTAGEEEDETTKNRMNNMSVILNTMDGILTPDKMIFIATSNHFDKIDEAIKRPGRFDLIIRLEKLTYELYVKMLVSLYEVDEDTVRADFKEVDYTPQSGSKVQSIFVVERDYEIAKEELKSLF